MMSGQIARAMLQRLHETILNPETELVDHSPFELLISVMLSAQATDKSVNRATQTLYLVANTPQKMVNLGEEALKTYIKTIGLYHTKAKHIIATCKKLIETFHGEIPQAREALESLPGVGRKTANILLNTLFDQPTIAVDTHVFRVSHRTGLADGKTPRAVEEVLMRKIPKAFLKEAHGLLVHHGRYTCFARRPQCARCAIRDLCEYPEK